MYISFSFLLEIWIGFKTFAKSKQRKHHEGETVLWFLAELRKILEACEFKGLLEKVYMTKFCVKCKGDFYQTIEVAIQQIWDL